MACTQRLLVLPAAWRGRVQVVAVQAPPATPNPQAQRIAQRQTIHQSIVHHLAAVLQCDAAQLAVSRTAGHAPILLCDGQEVSRVSLSITYCEGGALWAWSVQGAVGLDAQVVPSDGEDMEWQRLARQYLEPSAVAPLAQLQGAALRHAFAWQWVQLEAQLKCAGLVLSEIEHRPLHWSAQQQCLLLPEPAMHGVVAALAWRAG